MTKRLANNRSPRWAFMEKFIVPHYDWDKVYLTRWRLIQTPLFGIFLHRIETPDPRNTLHDHPWGFISIILRGGYVEQVESSIVYSRPRTVRRVNVKKATGLHYIERLLRVPTWTLMFVGRRKREWGYLDQQYNWTQYNKHPFNDEFMAALERYKNRTG